MAVSRMAQLRLDPDALYLLPREHLRRMRDIRLRIPRCYEGNKVRLEARGVKIVIKSKTIIKTKEPKAFNLDFLKKITVEMQNNVSTVFV